MDWKKIWLAEEQHAFSGWDFSHLDGRQESDALPWDYRQAALDGLEPQHRILDMDTGGGEMLLSLKHPYENTCATEGYAPNLALCRERLSPLGIDVRPWHAGENLPFEDCSFDRILNRHGSYRPSELYRVLKQGGRFVTQQVGGRNCFDLRKRLGFAVPQSDHDLAHNIAEFENSGFRILRAEEKMNPCRFYDAGAVVFQAKIIQWEFPGFSVEKNWAQLLEIQREIEKNGYVMATEHRFLIVAERVL